MKDMVTNELVDALSAIRQNPSLLTEEAKKAIANMALLLDGANRAIKETDQREREEQYEEWRQMWLNSFESTATKASFQKALQRFEKWCVNNDVSPMSLTYKDAENFSLSQECKNKERGEGERAPRSIRLTLEAISSMYSAFKRYSNNEIYNPFERIKTKPKNIAKKKKGVPDKNEIEITLNNTDGVVRAAIAIMALRGLRIGALNNLQLSTRNNVTTFYTITKGKEQRGELPKKCMEAIENAGLSKKEPFKNISTSVLTGMVQRALDKLASQGLITGHETIKKCNHKQYNKIVCDYSPHSLRHYFAVTYYEETHDIERLRGLLNHENLNITQTYLQSLSVTL